MESNVYTGVSYELHTTKPRWCRNNCRKDRTQITTREFQRRSHHDQGYFVSYELYEQGRGHRGIMQEAFTTSGYTNLIRAGWLNFVVTLLSKPPELQFVALRNAQLILEKRPEILRNDIKVFFCKYNDPIYVKLAKLEVIVKLATENNIIKVLEELQEYVNLVLRSFADMQQK